jgi:hypothetical protein
MLRNAWFCAIVLLLIAAQAFSQPAAGVSAANRVAVGRLASGASVSLVRSGSGEWGLEIAGAGPRFAQPKPAQIEVYRGGENARQLAVGYQSVQKQADAVLAKAKLADGEATFAVEDRWTISGAALSLNRKVVVTGAENNAGFFSAIRIVTDPKIGWADADYLVPGQLYMEPHTRATAPGGEANLRAKRLSVREDYLSAPLVGMSFRDGNWAAVLDMAPRGDTTWAETTTPATTPVIDPRIQFGALGAREIPEGGIELGFWLPGTTDEFSGGFGFGGRGRGGPTAPIVRRRYHPIQAGFSQTYQVAFRFGHDASFRGMERDAWRWAWETLKPKVAPIDVEAARRALLDHLADRVLVVDDRAGIPFVIDAVSGKPGSFRPAYVLATRGGVPPGGPPTAPPGGRGGAPAANATPMGPSVSHPPVDAQELATWAKSIGIDMDPNAAELNIWANIIMGFCGKHVEVAEQFLQESDRDPGPRGQRFRKLGVMIMDSLVRLVPMSPYPAGVGFNIRTGKVISGAGLRSLSEDMRILVDMLRREKAHGREHPEWFAWGKAFADFLLTQQKENGSFPTGWTGTGEPSGTSTVTSYAPIPFLVRMAEETGDKKYLDSAIRDGDYLWTNLASRSQYLGATGGDAADKESGMLSLEAFLSLYENTKNAKWLERAKSAGDYTESWIWIWNVPMPIGADPAGLGWKPGVPTTGANGIAANVPGEVDQYLDWAVPSYARLYKYTGDAHYLDVARVLLHGTKAMLALPGRTYDLKGPGWQQEHWRMGPGARGIGAHRTWLPWISINHLHGITGLEEFDKPLYQQLAKGN